ncbi:MAG: penicillin-binding transpeptidase domain-containing protein, partial [Planctomycetota bacterium]
ARLRDAIEGAVGAAARALNARRGSLRASGGARRERFRDLDFLLTLAVPEGRPPLAKLQAAGRAMEKALRPFGGHLVEAPGVPGAVSLAFSITYHQPIGREPGGPLVLLPDDGQNVAIGQGPVTVTPLQMVRGVAAIANGGLLVTPHVVLRSNGRPLPEPVVDLRLDPDDLARVREGMRGVVYGAGGTARHRDLQDLPATVYAKTGTSQPGAWWTPGGRPDRGPWHHWFVGFVEAPGRDPLAFACVLHARTEGAAGRTSAHAVAQFLDWWLTEGPGSR